VVWTEAALSVADAYEGEWTNAVADQRLSDWINSGILHTGMALNCPHCALSEFYRWRAMSVSDALCPRCDRTFRATPTTAICWAPVFALDDVLVAALIRHDGLEELALAAWLTTTSDAAALVLGTTWATPNGDVETDICGTLDADFTIGEAKSSRAFANGRQIGRIARLAERCNARRLIFATSQPAWSNGALAQMVAAREAHASVRVTVLVDLLTSPAGVAL
jgi:hypothetical protein